MNYMIISDYGVMLAKTRERLVIRGAKRRFEPVSDGNAASCLRLGTAV
jgi:hypothetical protein